jgi:hypothetical protein
MTFVCAHQSALADTTEYAYDALGRLTSVQIVGGVLDGAAQSFQYDLAGNRLQKQTLEATNPQSTVVVPATPTLNIMGGGSATLVLIVGDSLATGSISVTIDDVYVGTATVVNGTAEIQFQGAAPGNHNIRAIYTGDANNAPTTSVFVVKVQDLSWLPVILNLILE